MPYQDAGRFPLNQPYEQAVHLHPPLSRSHNYIEVHSVLCRAWYYAAWRHHRVQQRNGLQRCLLLLLAPYRAVDSLASQTPVDQRPYPRLIAKNQPDTASFRREVHLIQTALDQGAQTTSTERLQSQYHIPATTRHIR